MKILALSSIILVAFYYFLPSSKEGPQMDDVKLKLSSPVREIQRKRLPAKIKLPAPRKKIVEEVAPTSLKMTNVEASISVTEEDPTLEHVEEKSFSDHEKGWQDELSHIVVSLEPEYGEEMFNAYVTERNGYQDSLDELVRSHQRNQDLEYLIGELENKHEERVKEIFSRHYEEIKYHQSKFLESEYP